MLAQKALRVTRCSCGVLRSARAFSSEVPSESSSSATPNAPSTSASSSDLDTLWDRVIRTP